MSDPMQDQMNGEGQALVEGQMQEVHDPMQQSPDSQYADQDGQQLEYDEMDLTPYEEDDDATLHRKLCAAKVARKRAEEDLKLLCNRIGLLKNEEGKVSRERRRCRPR